MNNGVSMTNGAKLGVKTGYLSDCKNARDLEQALQAQVEFVLDTLELRLKYDAIRHSYLIPHPFQSILTRGCLQTGQDVSCSGAELTTVGVRMSRLIQTADSLTVRGVPSFSGGTVDGANDHRIVMAAAAAATAAAAPVTVTGAEAVRKSYPSFWEEYKRLGGRFDVL